MEDFIFFITMIANIAVIAFAFTMMIVLLGVWVGLPLILAYVTLVIYTERVINNDMFDGEE